MVLEIQVFRILADLECLVILGDQTLPLALGSQEVLSGRLYLVFPPMPVLKVLVGLSHPELLQGLVLLEVLVFLGYLVALETH